MTSTLPPSSALEPFSVIVARMAFEDKPNKSKPRPLVVIEVLDDALLVTAAKVTTHEPRAWCEGEVALRDWSEEGLPKPSTVRCTKLAQIPFEAVRAVVGMLTQRDRQAIEAYFQKRLTD